MEKMSNVPDENVPTKSSKVRSRSTSPEDKATDKNRRKKVGRIILKYEKLHPFETDISKIEIPPSLKRMTLVRRNLSVPEEEEGSRQGEGEREESTTVENDDGDDNENIMYSDNATDSNEDGSLLAEAVADPTTDAEVDQEEEQEEEIDDEYEYAEEQAEGPQMEEEDEEEEENIEDEANCEEEENNRTIFSIDKTAERFSAPVQFKHYVTNMQVFLSMLAFSIRAKLTYTSLIALFRSLRSMTINSVFPIYMASLWNLVSRNDDYANTRHYYCRGCKETLGRSNKPESNCSCGKCGPGKGMKEMSYFIVMKIIPQLRQLLTNKEVVNNLDYRFTREKRAPDALEDIYDGIAYKKLCEPNEFLAEKYNYSFGLFTDGAKVSGSSKASAWPVMLMIHELSPQARKKHVILAGIYVDTIHPDLHTLLLPMIEELQFLYDTGIQWKNPIDNAIIVSRFVTLVATLDSGARWQFLNMTQYNGEYGCTFCYEKGLSRIGKRVYPNPPNDVPVECRTNDQLRRDMEIADKDKKKEKGVKGYAAIYALRHFDLGRGMIVDSMHNIYLGIAKTHAELLIKAGANNPWYIGEPNNIMKINERLMKIKTPTIISRKPRGVDTMSLWKASEWRNWLLFYALPCLQDIVDDRHLNALGLLSRAAHIFNKDSISTDEMFLASRLLKKFIKKYENIFTVENMTYNIHLLNHLADSVKNRGPFWTHSAFPYESWNKQIIDNVTAANSRALQIATRFLMRRFVEYSMLDPDISIETRTMVNDILNCGSKKNKYVTDFRTGRPPVFQPIERISTREINDDEIVAITSAGYNEPRPLIAFFFKRAVIKGVQYHYRQNKTTGYCNEFIYCENTGKYGQIVQIISFKDGISATTVWGLLVEQFINMNGNSWDAEHMKWVSRRNTSIEFVAFRDDIPVYKPAFVIEESPDNNQFLMTHICNLWETD